MQRHSKGHGERCWISQLQESYREVSGAVSEAQHADGAAACAPPAAEDISRHLKEQLVQPIGVWRWNIQLHNVSFTRLSDNCRIRESAVRQKTGENINPAVFDRRPTGSAHAVLRARTANILTLRWQSLSGQRFSRLERAGSRLAAVPVLFSSIFVPLHANVLHQDGPSVRLKWCRCAAESTAHLCKRSEPAGNLAGKYSLKSPQQLCNLVT